MKKKRKTIFSNSYSISVLALLKTSNSGWKTEVLAMIFAVYTGSPKYGPLVSVVSFVAR